MSMLSRLNSNIVTVWGRNGTVGTGGIEELYQMDQALNWSAILATAAAVDITSSSAADAAAGTGLRTGRIIGMDSNYAIVSEVVTMNGQTAVTTTQTFIRVFGFQGLTYGSGGVNAGDIYGVKTTTSTWTSGVPDTVTSALLKVLATWSEGMNGMFTSPASTSYRLKSLLLSSYTQPATIFVQTRDSSGVRENFPVWGLGNQSQEMINAQELGLNISIGQKTDIMLRALGGGASAVVTGCMVLEKINSSTGVA